MGNFIYAYNWLLHKNYNYKCNLLTQKTRVPVVYPTESYYTNTSFSFTYKYINISLLFFLFGLINMRSLLYGELQKLKLQYLFQCTLYLLQLQYLFCYGAQYLLQAVYKYSYICYTQTHPLLFDIWPNSFIHYFKLMYRNISPEQHTGEIASFTYKYIKILIEFEVW